MLCRNGRKKATIEKKREKMRRINLCANENSYNNIVVACHNIKTKQIELKREREATARFGWSIMQTSKRYFFYLVQLQRYTNKHTEAHTQHNHWMKTHREKKSDAVKIPSILWNRNDAVYRFSHAHTPNSMCVCVCVLLYSFGLSQFYIYSELICRELFST